EALDGQAVPVTAGDAVELLALVAAQDVEPVRMGYSGSLARPPAIDLHRGHPGQAWAQVTAPPLRRVQGAPVDSRAPSGPSPGGRAGRQGRAGGPGVSCPRTRAAAGSGPAPGWGRRAGLARRAGSAAAGPATSAGTSCAHRAAPSPRAGAPPGPRSRPAGWRRRGRPRV